ncbi:hypothetical protein Btru_062844 [Bulinus truncatus]|nr:hypothetical protein Btru_062844 [Bulinus truncatus]
MSAVNILIYITANLCDLRQINRCDLQSTLCQSKDNQVGCVCKSGFTKSRYDPYSCIDIDECFLNKCNTSQFCTNVFGSYICSCEAGKEWDLTQLTCKDDECHPNPCKNGGSCTTGDTDSGFLCSCTYEWTGKTCEDYDSEARRMKIAVICISVILGFFCLCLLIILLVVCCKHRKTLESDSYTNSRFKDFDGVPRPKIKYAAGRPDMAENGRGNAYDSLYDNENDSHSSAGNHAHRNGDKGGGKYYTNKAYDSSEVVQERL